MSLSVSPAESVVLVGLCSALSIGVVLFQAKLSGELDEVDLGGNVTSFILVAVQYRRNMCFPCMHYYAVHQVFCTVVTVALSFLHSF